MNMAAIKELKNEYTEWRQAFRTQSAECRQLREELKMCKQGSESKEEEVVTQHLEIAPDDPLAWCGVNRRHHDVTPWVHDVDCVNCLQKILSKEDSDEQA
ncbi:MAG TPA: hypothetical protein ENI27_00290 [bacterium]|nr:hypothetical protein [bacterium]